MLGVPRYLTEKKKEGRMVKTARFRLESEMREEKYWERKEKVQAMWVGRGNGWEYVVEVCMREEGGGGKERTIEILDESMEVRRDYKEEGRKRRGEEERKDRGRTDGGRV